MRKKGKIVLAVLLLAVGGYFGWKWLGAKKEKRAPQIVTVVRGDLEITTLATGVVQPENRLELKPPIAGRVESILVEEGQRVTKGQVLAWLSSSERAALLDAARAKGAQEVAHWEELFKPTPLLAPLDGLIIVKNVVPGQVVAAADVVLVMSDRLIVNTQVDETDIAQIKMGQKVEITLDAYPKNVIAGHVTRLAFESKTVNNVTIYEVRVLPDRVPEYMRSGMTANVKFVSEFRENVLLVPAAALKKEKDRSVVVLVGPIKGERSPPMPVETGLSDGKFVEIVSGLSEGDQVLLPSLPPLSSGQGRPTSPFSPFGGGGRPSGASGGGSRR